LVRAKLGGQAAQFIVITESLHANALETMLHSGLITAQDLQDWTTIKPSTALIVKEAEE
jgi:hypothetical protein